MHAREQGTNRIVGTTIAAFLVIGIAGALLLRSRLSDHTYTEDRRPASPPITDLSQNQLCGPLSLHAAASMLGVQVDLPEIVEACAPSPAGVSMAALRRTARGLGLDAEGYTMTWEELLALKSPAILYCTRRHFVTVCSSRYAPAAPPESIRVFDLDKSPEWWSRSTLENLWSGETLVVSEARRVKRAKGARVKFDCLVHDLGDVQVPLGKKFDVPLIFENIGADTLRISHVKTTCGCAQTGIFNKALEPGERGRISLAVDLDKARGPFNYVVVVETNDPLTPIVKARITGRASNTQLTTRTELFLPSLVKGERTSKSFVLRDPGDGSLKRSRSGIGLSVSPPHLASVHGDVSIQATWSPFDNSKHQDMTRGDDDVVIEVTATASESAPVGEFDGTLEIATEIPNNERIQVHIHGLVVSNITAKPAALFFSITQGTSTSKNLTIESRTGHLPDLQTVLVADTLPITVEQLSKDSRAIILKVTCLPLTEDRHYAEADVTCRFAHEDVLTIPVIVRSQ